jgi:ribonuclease HI/probable phosphoglycerate mutase
MSNYSKTYVGYADGASRSTRGLSSAAWAIFDPSGELVSFRGVCIGRSTNNIAEYSALIELLSDTIAHGIRQLIVRLDSQLVVLQLSGIYSVRNPAIYRMFLRVKILEREFDSIQYQHISRNLNTLTDSLANYVLDRHLRHI